MLQNVGEAIMLFGYGMIFVFILTVILPVFGGSVKKRVALILGTFIIAMVCVGVGDSLRVSLSPKMMHSYYEQGLSYDELSLKEKRNIDYTVHFLDRHYSTVEEFEQNLPAIEKYCIESYISSGFNPERAQEYFEDKVENFMEKNT